MTGFSIIAMAMPEQPYIPSNKLIPEDYRELDDAFELFDADKDGRIEMADINVYLRCMGLKPTSESLQRLLAEQNLTGAASVSRDELMTIVEEYVRRHDEQGNLGINDGLDQLREAFRLFDRDRDGHINHRELCLVMSHLDETPITEEETKKMVDMANVKGHPDGVDMEDFLQFFLRCRERYESEMREYRATHPEEIDQAEFSEDFFG